MIKKIVIIGASTGGPSHIQKILSDFEVFDDTVVLIAQHIGAEYIPSFVSQLQKISKMKIHDIHSDTVLEASNIYVLSGKCELSKSGANGLILRYEKSSQTYNPNINHIFSSVSKFCSKYEVLSIILTGIGDDGALGCKMIHDNGGLCVAESKESAIIYGMPMRAKELNDSIKVEHLKNISNIVREFVR